MSHRKTQRSSEIELVVKDNLDWWVKFKWQRMARDGIRLKRELIHTATGEHFYISAKDTQGLQPMELGGNWPFLGAILPFLLHAVFAQHPSLIAM